MNSGYGSVLTMVRKVNDKILEKKSISEYGNKRIYNEIFFYKKIISSNIKFPIPKILNISDDNSKFTMEYLKEYITYQKYLEINNNGDKTKILNHLKLLHSKKKKSS